MHYALERLAFWGVRVFSVATGGDLTDRTGRLVASVMGWKDEAFLAYLRDKTRRGMAGQVRRGLSAGGRAMLEEAEKSVGELESTLKASATKRGDLTVLPSVVEGYLKDLRGSLGRNPERARELLAKLLGPITLRRDGDRLLAEMRGNLPALLGMDESLYNRGAGGRTWRFLTDAYELPVGGPPSRRTSGGAT